MTDLMTMATQERAELVDFLTTLSPADWDAPTLCDRWTVREVVAHMISYDELTVGATIGRFVRGALGRGRNANDIGVAEYAREPADLIALLRAHLRPRGLTAAFGGMIGLLDATIHHQDIRRPLGRTRTIPAERLRAALRLAPKAPPIKAFSRSRGLELVATDVDWSRGSGPQVRGPGEALLMAMAGRGDAIAELSGPGVSALAARI